jgi:hypothetical protein
MLAAFMRSFLTRLAGPLYILGWSSVAHLVVVVSLLTVLTGCSGFWLPSERTVYSQACNAIMANSSFPSGSELYPIEKCSMYIGKNAARIDIPFKAGVSGTESSCHVLLKRVARRWEVQSVTMKAANPTVDPA